MIDGVRVRPEKVEQAIAGMPGVNEVAVLPGQCESTTVVKAVVVAPGVTVEHIRAWSAAHLPAASVPAIITTRQALPRSPAGKVLYTKLSWEQDP